MFVCHRWIQRYDIGMSQSVMSVCLKLALKSGCFPSSFGPVAIHIFAYVSQISFKELPPHSPFAYVVFTGLLKLISYFNCRFRSMIVTVCPCSFYVLLSLWDIFDNSINHFALTDWKQKWENKHRELDLFSILEFSEFNILKLRRRLFYGFISYGTKIICT